jgi:hypothetical protein
MLRDPVFLHYNGERILILFNIDCFFPSLIFSDFKGNLVILLYPVYQSAYVNKNVLICFVFNDKTKSLPLIEKFYFTC